MTGKQQFINTGLKLFGSKTKIGKRAYSDMQTAELLEKQRVAEKWLKNNEGHPKYEEALKRYEEICNQINEKLKKNDPFADEVKNILGQTLHD